MLGVTLAVDAGLGYFLWGSDASGGGGTQGLVLFCGSVVFGIGERFWVLPAQDAGVTSGFQIL